MRNVSQFAAVALAVLLITAAGWSQAPDDAAAILAGINGVPFTGETRSGADIGLQGYYLGGTQQLSTTSGGFIRYHDFIPNVGLLAVSLESYGSDGRFRFGDNFVTLSGYVWGGRRWNFSGGDFRLSANPVATPFTNVINPEISARGVKIDTSSQGRLISVFFGEVTLLEGPRVPFRIGSGQYVMGANLRQKIGSRLTIGARLLRTSTSSNALAENEALFPANRQYLSATNAALESSFQWTKHLQLLAEVGFATGSLAPLPPETTALPLGASAPLTALAGAVYDTQKFTARLNYTSQGAAYLPVAGQFVGDRRGSFAEFRYRPFKALEVFGAVSRYRNNLEDNQNSTTFHSTSYSAGTSALLPLKFNVSAQLSELSYNSLTPYSSDADSPLAILSATSKNRQLSASVARSFGRQNLHYTWRDLQLMVSGVTQHQRSQELEDTVTIKKLSFGVAARLQSADAQDHRNTFFGRGSLQANFRRFQAYAQVEIGQDLVNQSVFSTSSFNTTVLGVSVPMRNGWVFHAEAFENKQNLALNPQNIFLLGDNAVGLPTTLPGFDQKSLYIRVTKSFSWGERLPGGSSLDQYTRQQIPVIGSVEGFVSEVGSDGSRRVEGIPVMLDGDRVVRTDSEGRFLIPAVPEGPHRVELALADLPAEFDPGAMAKTVVAVTPLKTSRADLQVIRLGEILGHVDAPPKSGDENDVENLVIRMEPGGRYTTPDAQGNFGFFNLPEGAYEIKVDAQSLPVNGVMTTPGELNVTVKVGQASAAIQFGYVIKVVDKPIHRTLEQTIQIDANGDAIPVPAAPMKESPKSTATPPAAPSDRSSQPLQQ